MSACPQTIDCCPPDPWGYLIHENLVTVENHQQCASLNCPSGEVFTACVDAGTYTLTGDIETQDAMQLQVDQEAADQALADAKTLLGTTCFGNQAWCGVVTCLPDGTQSIQYYAGDTDAECIWRAQPGQPATWRAPNVWWANSQAQADNLAKDSIAAQAQAQIKCPTYNTVEYWAVGDCQTETVADCITSDPGTAPGKVVGHAAIGDASGPDLTTANANACALARSRAQQAVDACVVPAHLSGLVWQMPCNPPVTDGNNPACACQDVETSVPVGGKDHNTIYNAKLWIRGAVELKYYFYSPGDVVSNIGSYAVRNARPNTSPDHVNFNRYSLLVDDPPQNYVLNNGTGLPPTDVYLLDYQLTIQVKTGSVVTLRAESMDQKPAPGQGFEWRADYQHWTPPGRIVPDSDPTHYPLKVTQPAPRGYNGQWLQMDCLGITPAPPPHA